MYCGKSFRTAGLMRPLEHIGIRMVYLQKVQTATKIESYPLGAAGIDITSHATLANGIGAEIVTRGLAYCA